MTHRPSSSRPSSSRLAVAALALAGALLAAPASAETMRFRAELKGAAEVPPVAGSGGGFVDATYDSASRKLEWKGAAMGLSGPATAGHFHGPAAEGANAGVMVPAPVAPTGAIEGSATLTEAQATALTGGMTYFNVHTAANPNGEARGQVVKAP